MSKKTFYVSTPIYYPSGKLHIGHAYTTTLADILKRYKKEMGYETFFLTGSDEHGQKIEQKAEESKVSPQEYVDEMVLGFKELWRLLDISNDKFIRTTDSYHVETVKKIFTEIYKKGFIYPSIYEGKYCKSCEEFLTKEQMNEKGEHLVCLKEATNFKEETYMLKVSNFVNYLNEIFETNFLEPENRKKEMLNNFVNNNLEDLSITRISFTWGIPINENPKHIVYVWLDALTNYITALGYMQKDDNLFKKFWSKDTEIVQLVGKEITRFHSIYWPIILKTLDLRMPDKLLSHGWILSNNNKMSKSIGNVVDPIELIKKYSSDALRFYIANDLPMNRDGSFTEELFVESFNTNLANNFGNLISRVSQMIIKYFDGLLKATDIENHALVKEGIKTIESYQKLMNQYNISEATSKIIKLGQECNKFIEDSKPWVLAKENKIDELNNVLTILQRNILIISYLLKPILVKKYSQMIEQMGVDEEQVTFDNLLKNKIKYNKITNKLVLFERIK
ncbi:methionine--tRNA ligase [Spiroplasma endosymbiont of Crioceris asparagi]|uniref:methionine--tRNA ligase n=1 Tax=Spiroplasma endosymbiont of Crioceris asparagi TaxID=3066286 RepID=UPI0030D444BF